MKNSRLALGTDPDPSDTLILDPYAAAARAHDITDTRALRKSILFFRDGDGAAKSARQKFCGNYYTIVALRYIA